MRHPALGGALGATLVMYATQIATGVLLLGSMAMSNSAKKKAERQELFLQKDMIVEEFLDDNINPYKALAQRSIARTTIINWEFWKNKNAE